jgi:hypothetical protein
VKEFEPRKERRFPVSQEEWANAPAGIGRTRDGATLEILGFQVMQEWESPLMARMAGAVARAGGIVLEIGYGLGISARFIQSLGPKTHVIIEANRDVASNARSELQPAISSKRAHIIEDFWEHVVGSEQLRSFAPRGFDGILFDTYPLSKSELRRNHFKFFPHTYALLAECGRFTYFSDEKDGLSTMHSELLRETFPNSRIDTEIVSIEPWKDCEYWTSRTILHVVVTKGGHAESRETLPPGSE